VLTTNEESFFLKNVHKANLNTDGALNFGICTLHSAGLSSPVADFVFRCGSGSWVVMRLAEEAQEAQEAERFSSEKLGGGRVIRATGKSLSRMRKSCAQLFLILLGGRGDE
jgi:hypothetical protein